MGDCVFAVWSNDHVLEVVNHSAKGRHTREEATEV